MGGSGIGRRMRRRGRCARRAGGIYGGVRNAWLVCRRRAVCLDTYLDAMLAQDSRWSREVTFWDVVGGSGFVLVVASRLYGVFVDLLRFL